MDVEEPTLLLRTYDTIFYKLSEKEENEEKVMHGIEKTNSSPITYWPRLDGQRRKI